MKLSYLLIAAPLALFLSTTTVFAKGYEHERVGYRYTDYGYHPQRSERHHRGHQHRYDHGRRHHHDRGDYLVFGDRGLRILLRFAD
jgi:hypothetical protein